MSINKNLPTNILNKFVWSANRKAGNKREWITHSFQGKRGERIMLGLLLSRLQAYYLISEQ